MSSGALAFKEMHTPYASERGICVQKFRKVYQQKKKEEHCVIIPGPHLDERQLPVIIV